MGVYIKKLKKTLALLLVVIILLSCATTKQTASIVSDIVTVTVDAQSEQSIGNFIFNLSSTVIISNEFSITGTITGENELTSVIYQVYKEEPSDNHNDFQHANFEIGSTEMEINITDIMTSPGLNNILLVVKDINGNKGEETISLENDFGIHEFYESQESDIVTDPVTDIQYAKDQLVIYFRGKVTHQYAIDFINEIVDADILSFIERPKVYTVRLRNSIYYYEDFEQFCDELSSDYDDILFGAHINYITSYRSERTPEDPWKSNTDSLDFYRLIE